MTISSAYPAACLAPLELPGFDQYGLLPAGIYNSDINSVKERFCQNDHRKKIFLRFEDYIQNISRFGIGFACFIDGSFISDKDDPKDIDIVIDVPDRKNRIYQEMASRPNWLNERWLLFDVGRVRREFGLHFFHWSPIMQIGGPNDQIKNFQSIYAQTAVDIQSRKGIRPSLNHEKGIVRILI